jgi:hypothetical protein
MQPVKDVNKAGEEVLGSYDFLFRARLDNVNVMKLNRHINIPLLVRKTGGYMSYKRLQAAASTSRILLEFTIEFTIEFKVNSAESRNQQGRCLPIYRKACSYSVVCACLEHLYGHPRLCQVHVTAC